MIELSEAEREELAGFMRRGKANARNIKRAQILLKSAEGWSIARLTETFDTSAATVSNVRARYRAGGVARVLKDKIQQNRRRALAGAEEALLVAIPCSPVPDGHDHWTVRMLRDKLVALGVVEHIGKSTVQERLKKMISSRGSAKRGVSRSK